MTKDKNGITIISLVITVIVMLIIFGITLISGTTLLDKTRLTKIEMFLMMIKTKADIVAEETGFNYRFDAEFLDADGFIGGPGPSDDSTEYTLENDYTTIWCGNMVKFSENIKKNKQVSAYNYQMIRTFGKSIFYDYYGNNDYTPDSEYTYGVTPYNRLVYRFNNSKIRVRTDENFVNLIHRIYPRENYEFVRGIIPSEIVFCDGEFEDLVHSLTAHGVMDRYFYVKWGEDECLSHGIISKSNDPSDGTSTYTGKVSRVDSSLIDDAKGKYAIVVYDLKTCQVASVAYSVGYRMPDGKMAYTLDEMLKIDEEE